MRKPVFQLVTILLFSLLASLSVVRAQDNTVEGQVVSSDDGLPLPGVNVLVQDTDLGTSTDADGEYELQVPPENNVLVFSYLGYETQEIGINGQTRINVELVADIEALGDELVVVGYGRTPRSDLTGSISSIRGDEITTPAVSNPVQAIQGRASGVQVTSSGDPGSSPSIRIRGIGTTGDSSPLFVVDGLFVDDISYLNNNDIESMEILKDASATAIYGSRGANGVVLITTRQGTTSEPVFSFSMSEGLEQPKDFQMTDASEYATLMNEGLENIGEPPAYDVDEIDTSTDWFDEVLRVSAIRNYNLNFSQSTGSADYFVSLGYYNQLGNVEKSGYERFTVRLNNQYSLSDNITVGHNFAGNFSDKDERFGGAFDGTYRIPPTVPVYTEDGDFNDTGIGSSTNVIASINYHNNFTETRSLIGNAYLDINFLEHFHFRSSIGLDLRDSENTNFNPEYFVSNQQQNEVSSLSKSWANTQNYLWENTVNYIRTFNDIHRVDGLLGFTAQENNFELLGGNRNQIFGNDSSLWYLNAGVTDGAGNVNEATSSAIRSYLSRINYTLMDRYLFTGTLRVDGSSRFPSHDRFGYFPSLALGWRISEENFMQDTDWFSELKLRGSWGQLGNDRIGEYQYFATAATGVGVSAIFGGQIVPGAAINTLVNQNITWETTEQFDVGVELGFFNDRILAEVDWYRRVTRDMLVNVGVSPSVGLGTTEGNVGSVENTGLDFGLDFRGDRDDFFYSIGFSGSTINNTVLDLGTEDELIGGNIGAGINISRARVDMPIGFFYGYDSLGPFDTQEEIDAAPAQSDVEPGDLQMRDVNGDGEIGPEDRTLIGSPIPDFTGGLNVTLGYRNLELSVDMYGAFGHDIYDASNNVRFSGEDAFSREWLDRWTGPGTSDRIPRITFGGDWNYEPSSRWVHDGSYVKLNNVRLQYTLPPSVMENLPVSLARIHVSGNNLHYFTSYEGFTPEFAAQNDNPMNAGLDGNIYPVSSIYTFGATINF
ncbi:MAG: TonB-dependent receptor [Balneolales bacterium]